MTFYTEAGLDAYAAIKDGSLDMALDRMPENEIGMEKCVCFAKELIREKQCILMAPDHPLAQKKNASIMDCREYTMPQDWSIRWKTVSSERHMVNRISHGKESSAQTTSTR